MSLMRRSMAHRARRLLHAALVFSFTLPLAASGLEQAKFHNAATNVGDEGEQTIEMTLDMNREFSQAGTVISTEKLHVRRHQLRHMKVLKVNDGVASRVIVTFVSAYQYAGKAGKEAQEQRLPVDGRTYDVSRVGEELRVLTEAGDEPEAMERDIVVTSMAALGRPNPLGQLLDGKTLRKGDSIKVPAALVNEFFAGNSSGAATMDLRLVELKAGSSSRRAVFEATMDTGALETGELDMKMVGHWEVEVATCQTLLASFQGPVHSSEQHGPVGAQYQITTHGDLDVRVTRVPTLLSR